MRRVRQTARVWLGVLALLTCAAARAAAPVLTNMTVVGTTPQFRILSDLGITNQIQYSPNLGPANWVVLTNLLVTQSPYWFVDVGAAPASQRFYRVAARVVAQAAAPVLTNMTVVGTTPQFRILSDLGITNQIQYCTNLGPANWVVLTNLLVTQSPYWFVDVGAPPASRRFYRVAALVALPPAPSGMVLIPSGPFTMGNCMDPAEGFPDELPLHTVSVSAFYMDTNLVSHALWQEVYQWALSHGYDFDYAGSGKAANHPVQSITWHDAVKWCNARSEKESLVPAYYTSAGQTNAYRTGQTNVDSSWVKWAAGYRLPTEAEWEKAARGGASGHRFPWSDADTITQSRANYYSYWVEGHPYWSYDTNATAGYHLTFAVNGTPYTSPVGYFAPNGYGLYDMAGNVWQWCWDWYDGGYYSSSPGSDPRGPASGSERGLRGASWYYSAGNVRCALRLSSPATAAFYVVGFRCVRGF